MMGGGEEEKEKEEEGGDEEGKKGDSGACTPSGKPPWYLAPVVGSPEVSA